MPSDADRSPKAVAAVVAGLAADGIAVVPDFLPPDDIAGLRQEAMASDAVGALAPAGIGRGTARIARTDIRGDRIRWLDENAAASAETTFWARLTTLRDTLNRELMLGLWDFEGHYALYPPGARYAMHRDRFRDDDTRVVSCILYLNEAWGVDDGGALRLWAGAAVVREVHPTGGTLVTFLADRFPHEVLPARRPRLALTGWFRRRPSSASAGFRN